MNKLISILILLSLILSFESCKKKEEDNTALIAGLVLLNQRSTSTGATTTGTRTQVRQASTGRAAATSSASAARSAARTSFRIDKSKGLKKNELMAFLKHKMFGSENPSWNKSNKEIKTIPTAVTCTNASGGSCSDTSTSVVFTGTSDCTNGGTSTLNSLASTLDGSNQDALTITLTGGTLSYSSCGLSPTDFVNYPATTRITITSGTITPRGTYKKTDSYNSSTGTNTVTTVEDLTVNGSIVVAGSTVTLTNLKSTTNLTEIDKETDLKYLNQSGSALTSSQVAADTTFSTIYGVSGITTANGTLVLSGQVNGADAGANLSLTNKTITWQFLCTKAFGSMTEADWASDTVCKYTIQ